MQLYSLFGWVCTSLFAISYIPQIWLTYKTKKVDDISVSLWWILLIAYTCGLYYGIHLKEWPLIWGYIWGFSCSSIFLIMFYKYRSKK